MKKFSTVIFAMLMSASLVLGQTGGDKNALNPQPLTPGRKAQPSNGNRDKNDQQKERQKRPQGWQEGQEELRRQYYSSSEVTFTRTNSQISRRGLASGRFCFISVPV